MKWMVYAALAGTVEAGRRAGTRDSGRAAVTFTLTDLDYAAGRRAGACRRPAPTRTGNKPTAGTRLVTDAKGGRWETRVELEEQMKKMPTNFAGSLSSGPQKAQYLRVGAEMTYFERPWLYTVDLYRFAGGDTLQDDSAVYTRDERGAFTRKSKQDKNGWTMADMGGLVLTMPGFEAWNFALDPDPADPTQKRWTLKLFEARRRFGARRTKVSVWLCAGRSAT
jgi:hypothetical protein